MFNTQFLAAPANGQGGSPWGSIIIMVAFIAIFYFLMIRPQQKKAKQVKQMLDSLKPGDRVRTIGGLYGKIAEINEEENLVILEFGYENKVKIAFERSAVAQVNDTGVEGDQIKE